jgi:hypothetical protein
MKAGDDNNGGPAANRQRVALAVGVGIGAAVLGLAAGWLAWAFSRSVYAPDRVALSGVHEVRTEVPTGPDGLTTEQRNIRDRLRMDNTPGSIKHLYVISAYSGDVLLYSTVRGKVTSSGKRLSPTAVAAGACRSGDTDSTYGIPVQVGGQTYHTGEVLQDDGTYGHSIEYLFWFDAAGRYHQHYPNGGQIIHISDEPLVVKKPVINLEGPGTKE